MIVLNTLLLAVTEYDWQFQSITPTHAGDATGLFEFGGDLDGEALIQPSFMTAKTLLGESRRSRPEVVYFSMSGDNVAMLTVRGEEEQWDYEFPVRPTGTSRAVPGKGIRENYLAYGFSKPDGGSFIIDRVEILEAESQKRRVS